MLSSLIKVEDIISYAKKMGFEHTVIAD